MSAEVITINTLARAHSNQLVVPHTDVHVCPSVYREEAMDAKRVAERVRAEEMRKQDVEQQRQQRVQQQKQALDLQIQARQVVRPASKDQLYVQTKPHHTTPPPLALALAAAATTRTAVGSP